MSAFLENTVGTVSTVRDHDGHAQPGLQEAR